MGKLILLRHGQSEWNKRNLFTGWVDIPLSPEGIQESLAAGRKMAHMVFDAIFVSTLVRAQTTLFLAMSENKNGKVPYMVHEEMGKTRDWSTNFSLASAKDCIPVYSAWQLNERMYGDLQGLNKKETMDQFGEAQVKIWRRSYEGAPPHGESLSMTASRTIPYFQKRVIPFLVEGKTVLIAAHGNSLRAIVMTLEKLSPQQVVELEIATGDPLIYHFDKGQFQKSLL